MANAQSLFQSLVNRGYAPHVAAGIVGNMAQESNFDEGAVGDNGNAYGLMQWNGPRKEQLFRYAKTNKPSAEQQLDFMDSEMESGGLRALLDKASNPTEAARLISDKYERPNPRMANNERRQGVAEAALNLFVPPAQADETPDYSTWVPVDNAGSTKEPDYSTWVPVEEKSDSGRFGPAKWVEGTTPINVVEARNNFIDREKAKGPPSIVNGLGRGVERKIIGAQQLASDVARLGTGSFNEPKSAYREALDARGRVLRRESENAPFVEKAIETVPATLGAMLMPGVGPVAAGESALANTGRQMLVNGAQGGLLNLIDTYETPEERLAATGKGVAEGAIIPGVIQGGSKIAQVIGRGAPGRQMAARSLGKQLEQFGKNAELSLEVPPIPPSVRGEAGANFMGPEQPRFGFVPGVEPTAAMLHPGNQKIAELERFARLTNGPEFSGRDLANTEAVVDALRGRAFDNKTANELQAALNAKTGPIRDTAQQFAGDSRLSNLLSKNPRSGGVGYGFANPRESTIVEPVRNKLNSLPGYDADSNSIKSMAEPYLKEGTPESLYQLRKRIDEKLELSRGQAIDKESAVFKANRKTLTELKKSIDEGLNDASGGLWAVYTKEHGKGMAAIDEGRTFNDILERFNKRAPLPSGKEGITPAGLRSAEDAETWKNLGKTGVVDILSPEGRLMLSDSIDTMNAIERAKSAGGALNGSQTMPLAMVVAKHLPGGGKVGAGLQAISNLATGQGRLSNALLNPKNGELAKIIAMYEKQKKPLPKWVLQAARAGGNVSREEFNR